MNPNDFVKIDLQLEEMKFSIMEGINSQLDLIKKEAGLMVKAKIKQFDFKKQFDEMINAQLQDVVSQVINKISTYEHKWSYTTKMQEKIEKYYIHEIDKTYDNIVGGEGAVKRKEYNKGFKAGIKHQKDVHKKGVK